MRSSQGSRQVPPVTCLIVHPTESCLIPARAAGRVLPPTYPPTPPPLCPPPRHFSVSQRPSPGTGPKGHFPTLSWNLWGFSERQAFDLQYGNTHCDCTICYWNFSMMSLILVNFRTIILVQSFLKIYNHDTLNISFPLTESLSYGSNYPYKSRQKSPLRGGSITFTNCFTPNKIKALRT